MHPYTLHDVDSIPSPALIFFPHLIQRNIDHVLALAGSAQRLRPHVKTHKTREITRLQLQRGITKHKCATIAEAELLAQEAVPDVLIAYPIVGPNLKRLAELLATYPGTRFSVLLDHAANIAEFARAQQSAQRELGFFVDLDVGQHRTGIPVGDKALSLYQEAAHTGQLTPRGLHAYDGHNHQESAEEREAAVRAGLAPVLVFAEKIRAVGLPCPAIVAGGTPTFPIYAAMRDIPGLECSPGTYVLHDHGYGSKFRDFTGVAPAAVLLTRVISRPTPNRVTLDLGNKAVAADPLMTKRVHLLDLPSYSIVGHNEEHLIIETEEAGRFRPGDVAYALPGHVCPTVALHREALIADEQGRVIGRWSIAARDRSLTI